VLIHHRIAWLLSCCVASANPSPHRIVGYCSIALLIMPYHIVGATIDATVALLWKFRNEARKF
jgi:hypothetical protein